MWLLRAYAQSARGANRELDGAAHRPNDGECDDRVNERHHPFRFRSSRYRVRKPSNPLVLIFSLRSSWHGSRNVKRMERCGGPYRSAWHSVVQTREHTTFDRDLFYVCAVLWVGSVMRVLVGVMRHEAFGAELSLAATAIAALPYAALMKS